MAELRFMPAAQTAPAVLHAAFTEAFSDYLIGPFRLPLAHWPQFTGRQGVDIALSEVAVRGGQVLAFILVAPRPELATWRLGTMGAVPQARGSGAAQALLDRFAQHAAQHGMQQLELECFAQNERALRLYRGRGFQALHELHGYVSEDRTVATAESAGEAQSIALDHAFAWLEALSLVRGDLPLQVTPVSLRALPVQLRAWGSGSAQLVFSDNGEGLVTVHSLVDTEPAQQGAQALAAQLRQAHPAHKLVVPQLQRDDLGGQALRRLGWVCQPLHQLMMRKRLAPD